MYLKKMIERLLIKIIGEDNARNLYYSRINVIKTYLPKKSVSIPNVYSFRSNEAAKYLALGVINVCGSPVAGDIAEFGTAYGTTAQAIAQAIQAAKRDIGEMGNKKLFLFDSFVGLPEVTSSVDREKPHVKNGVWGRGTCRGLNKEQLRSVCEKYLERDKIIIYDGWFTETVLKLPKTTLFSMIHFDGDLYQSTIDALGHCFENRFISNGAMLFFDDWNCNFANPNWGERKAWSDLVEKYSISYSDEGSYACTSHVFIIHSYLNK